LFERPHHRRIARVLEGLDAELLLKSRCLFGGGTAIALAHGEYRESVDVDFVCSSVDGYRELRSLVHRAGIDALFKAPLPLLRGPKIDQYGIRCALAVEQVPVKFEIVFEGRVALADPGPDDRLCGVWTLALEDRVATKLMANSDRWADDSVMSRDLIDLAMLSDTGLLPPAGVAKARHAYGDSIAVDVAKAREHLLGRAGRLKACMDAMAMRMPIAELRLRIERLKLAQAPAARRKR
jgi:hypothetical protein